MVIPSGGPVPDVLSLRAERVSRAESVKAVSEPPAFEQPAAALQLEFKSVSKAVTVGTVLETLNQFYNTRQSQLRAHKVQQQRPPGRCERVVCAVGCAAASWRVLHWC